MAFGEKVDLTYPRACQQLGMGRGKKRANSKEKGRKPKWVSGSRIFKKCFRGAWVARAVKCLPSAR